MELKKWRFPESYSGNKDEYNRLLIQEKVFLIYRDLVYEKLETAYTVVNNMTKVKPTTEHIEDILKRTEIWLKSEVAKQADPDKSRPIIEDAANVAAKAFLIQYKIKLVKTKENALSAVENLLNSVHITQGGLSAKG